MKHRNLSDYAIKRLKQRKEDSDFQKELRRDNQKRIFFAITDALAMVLVVVAITCLAMLDSVSLVPGIVFGVLVIVLTVYGAFRGVLG